MTIDTVLFDADGVVQRQVLPWSQAFGSCLDGGQLPKIDEFIKDLVLAEEPSLVGNGDFADAVGDVLKRWNCSVNLKDFLQIWTRIESYGDVIEVVQALRKSGFRCCLATNQQSHRAAHMSANLRYRQLFDREFYSCELRLKKPDDKYFLEIARQLNSQPQRVLFLDDHEVNVDAARSIGFHATKYEGKTGAPTLWQILSGYGIGMP